MGTEAVRSARSVSLAALWAAAVAVAWLGVELTFDAEPGINWGIWTAVAGAHLVYFARAGQGRIGAGSLALATLAAVLAFGAAVTANSDFYPLILLAVGYLLAVAMLLTADDRVGRLDLPFLMWAPFLAGVRAPLESLSRAGEAADALGDRRSAPVVRGVALALPVVAVFALLLANADPVFAAWRDGLWEAIRSRVVIPKLVLFGFLLTATLGAYGVALAGKAIGLPSLTGLRSRTPFRFGSTERLMVLGSVALLFALFLLLQLSYLFGNAPAVAGSGITFAEYARRGFGELTVVATACTLLLVVLHRRAEPGARERTIGLLQLAIVAELLLLVASAVRRVWLYEAAYGFTTSRLYAQAYMAVVTVVLLALGRDVRSGVDLGRLVRVAGLAGVLTFTGLTYWNHEEWIAERNLDRYEATGKLDVPYLSYRLSPDAVPTVVAALPRLDAEASRQVRACLRLRYARATRFDGGPWFEWNLGRARAARALRAAHILDGTDTRQLHRDQGEARRCFGNGPNAPPVVRPPTAPDTVSLSPHRG